MHYPCNVLHAGVSSRKLDGGGIFAQVKSEQRFLVVEVVILNVLAAYIKATYCRSL